MNAGNFFLGKLFFRNKPLFWLVLVFIIGQGFFTYKGVQTLPFFHFGMYSEVFAPKDHYELLSIYLDSMKIDQKNSNGIPFDFVIETLEYYQGLQQLQFKDPILATINKRFENRVGEITLSNITSRLANDSRDAENYKEWLMNLLQRNFNEDAKTLRIEIVTYEYVDKRMVEVNRELLFEHAESE